MFPLHGFLYLCPVPVIYCPLETDLSVQSHETLQLVNVDEAQLQIYAPNLSAQDKQALKDGTGCLVKNPIAFSYRDTTVQQTDLTVGDAIQLGGTEHFVY